MFDADVGAAVEGSVAAGFAELLVLAVVAVHVAVTDVAPAQADARRQGAVELRARPVRPTPGPLDPAVPLVRAVRAHPVAVTPADRGSPTTFQRAQSSDRWCQQVVQLSCPDICQ